MKLRRRFGLTTALILVTSILLPALNSGMRLMMMNQPKEALRQLIGERMLDIANTAAAMLDGDVETLAEEIVFPEDDRALRNRADGRRGNEIDDIRRQIQTTQSRLGDYIAYTNALAYRDGMTGVGNKAAYLDRARELDRRIAAGNAAFTVAVFDINSLKQVMGKTATDIEITGGYEWYERY